MNYICSFILRAREKGGNKTLACRVTWCKSKCIMQMSVGYVVDPKNWSTDSQRCKKATFHGKNKIPSALINRDIERYQTAVMESFDVFSARDITPTVDQLRDAVRCRLGLAVKGKALQDAFREFNEEILASCSYAARKNILSAEKHITDYRPTLSLDDITLGFMKEYRAHLISLGLKNASSLKLLKNALRFIKWADEKNYIQHKDVLKFSPDLEIVQNKVIFLTWSELMSVWQYQPWKPEKEEGHKSKYRTHDILTRDIFCFCAFTSLRWSDAQDLKWSQIEADAINVTTIKTTEYIRVDLNEWSREILDRYRSQDNGGYVFPRLANQVANRNLKIICKSLGMDTPIRMTSLKGTKRVTEEFPKWKLIGTHAARRTFVCNALMMGIPAATVMKWTGHSSWQAMKPYIDVADEARKAEMAKFDRRRQ